MQNTSLRGVVITIGVLVALWSLLWGIGSFQTINTDKEHGQPKLASLAIILGCIYMGACGISILGVIAACMVNRFMLRMYTLLSVVSSFAVVGAALMRVIVHFLLKSDLETECEQIVQGDTVYYQYGFWGPTYETKLTQQQATEYCTSSWSHDSFVEIIMLIVELLLAAFFTSIAFAYYRQVLDPTSPANVSRRAPVEATGDTYPPHYNPPYLAYDAAPGPYAPPPGEPPAPYDPVGKPPGYDEYDAGYGAGLKGDDKDDGKGDDPFEDFEHSGVEMPKAVVEDPFEDYEHREGRGPKDSGESLV